MQAEIPSRDKVFADLSVTDALVAFTLGAKWDDMPESARDSAHKSLVNIIGCALGGANDPAIQKIVTTLKTFCGPPQAILLGRKEILDRPKAALINAAAANVLDFDDTHFPSVAHPSAPVFAPLISIAQERRVSGIEFLTAFAIGIEVACRIARAVHPQHYQRGSHITATCGVFGAAMACARLLHLTPQRTRDVLGIAAGRASGLVENLGSMAKSISVGTAAQDGYLAALFGQNGIDAAECALEGPRGFLAVACDQPDLDAITEGLGQRWEAENNCWKPYPCGVVLNPVIDAAIELAVADKIKTSDVERVEVVGNPLLVARTDRPDVITGREAKISVQHTVAWTLLHGSAEIGAFLDEAVRNRSVQALRAKVQVREDDDYSLDAATVEIVMKDGSRRSARVDAARGSRARPLTREELSDKFVKLARWGTSGVHIERLLDALWSLDQLGDVRSVMRLGVPS